jgi:elongation of very long chain fatty acids protein 4
MAQMMEYLKTIYNDLHVGVSPIMDSYPLMGSPFPTMFIIIAFLLFVLYVGPKIMDKRKPLNIKNIMIFYNIYQVFFSAILIIVGFSSSGIRDFALRLGCVGENRNEEVLRVLYHLGWWFYFNKIVELLDTVFFVLRKKQTHVSFLHVFHHCDAVIFTWCFLKYSSDEQGLVVGFFNSIVHVVMYFYYLLAVMGPKFKRFLGWKRFVTMLQILQFVIIIFYFAIMFLRECQIHYIVVACLVINTVVFLVLFLKFYYRTYIHRQAVQNINV